MSRNRAITDLEETDVSFDQVLLLTSDVASADAPLSKPPAPHLWKEGAELQWTQAPFQQEHPLIRFHSFPLFLLTFGSRLSQGQPIIREGSMDFPPAR